MPVRPCSSTCTDCFSVSAWRASCAAQINRKRDGWSGLIPDSETRAAVRYAAITSSKSSPPSATSPSVAMISIVSPPTSTTDTSNVPPPKSNTRHLSSSRLSQPYASAAASGSRSRCTCPNPASIHAVSVAARCASEKCAGTATTAVRTGLRSAVHAPSSSARKISADTSTAVIGLSSASQRISNSPDPSAACTRTGPSHLIFPNSSVVKSRLPRIRFTERNASPASANAYADAVSPTNTPTSATDFFPARGAVSSRGTHGSRAAFAARACISLETRPPPAPALATASPPLMLSGMMAPFASTRT
mmetsp:Transcript_18231/g.46664  ORF Transcript_18231/g.46664 Transcript_18231/m.46664 type:complete len:305 (-) Transcript_18231:775-1689(-)